MTTQAFTYCIQNKKLTQICSADEDTHNASQAWCHEATVSMVTRPDRLSELQHRQEAKGD